jgi:hypothetical protein
MQQHLHSTRFALAQNFPPCMAPCFVGDCEGPCLAASFGWCWPCVLLLLLLLLLLPQV